MSPPAASATVFDTSAVIGLTERRSPVLIDIVKSLGRPITRSITVYGELRHGAALADRPRQSDRARTLDRYQRLSEWSETETALDEVGQIYGDVSAMASANELRLGMNDRWIIAESVVLGARLVTGDRRQAHLAELVGARRAEPLDIIVAD